MRRSNADLRRRVDRGLDLLQERFGTPESDRRLRPLDELILTVLSQNTNDRNRDRAYESLRRIAEERGELDLDFLQTVPAGDARSYLERFRGVGEKTICCVLLFSCGHAAFPVDTHIHRITRRLGWVAPGASPARTHDELARLIPAARYYPAHVNLITLGRQICRPRNPDCGACPLRRSCRFAARAKPLARANRARSRMRSVPAR